MKLQSRFAISTIRFLARFWQTVRCHVLVVSMFAALGLAMLGGAVATTSTARLPAEPIAVRIRAATPSDAQRLAALGLDLLEARDGDDLFALVSPVELKQLRDTGWHVRLAATSAPQSGQAQLNAFADGYRTVEETEQLLRTTAAQYPTLTTLVDYGDSWERQQPDGAPGYDLLALRLTNKAIVGPKPVFFLLAAIHPRELATSELANRFITHLVRNYGSDATITWLLDEHEIVVVPMANPDGRKIAEQLLLQRKNTNTSYGGACDLPPTSSDQIGVDLNRNFSYLWGTVDAPTGSNQCAATFPGSAPASEPETRALQDFIVSLYPDRPRPADGQPVPPETSGVLISLHSFSDLVLWPWGTNQDAPNAVELERLGKRFAAFNGYQAYQSYLLYPTSGTTDDWAYAELGVAAYTFEVGPIPSATRRCGGFMPPYDCLDSGEDGRFWPRNLPALLYAAQVARAPYTQPAGPDVRAIDVAPDGDALRVTVTLDGGDAPVTAAEIYIGASPWRGGTAIALEPLDGAFDSPQEVGFVVLPDAIDPKQYILARGRTSTDAWGPLDAAWQHSPQPPEKVYWLPLFAE